MKVEDGFDSHYSYVLVAARRARQLQMGSRPLITTGSTKPCRVAQDEIAAGKVGYVLPETLHKPEVEAPIIPKFFVS
ncbi:MAG TPA: DNA-directed RNA polymerase subunit omega [Acidisarcina sp.]